MAERIAVALSPDHWSVVADLLWRRFQRSQGQQGPAARMSLDRTQMAVEAREAIVAACRPAWDANQRALDLDRAQRAVEGDQ